MTRVERVVEAVRRAETVEAIEKELSKCTKMELNEVLSVVSDEYAEEVPKSWKKSRIVTDYAEKILEHRKYEAFSCMSLEERCEYLTDESRTEIEKRKAYYFLPIKELDRMSQSSRVAASSHSYEDVVSAIKAHAQARELEKLSADGDPCGLKAAIRSIKPKELFYLNEFYRLRSRKEMDHMSLPAMRETLYEYYLRRDNAVCK